MSHLATLPKGSYAPAASLATAARIPPHYISKIMRRLVLAELVMSQRGHGGGFSLARPPASIRFSEILTAVGFPSNSEKCIFGWDSCDPNNPCPLHPSWIRLKEAFAAWGAETTLANVQEEWGKRRTTKDS